MNGWIEEIWMFEGCHALAGSEVELATVAGYLAGIAGISLS